MEQTLGDFITPTRTGCMTDVVNRVSQTVGADVKAWRVDRLLRMMGALEQAQQTMPPE